MKKLTLVSPHYEFEVKALDFRKEFFDNGEKTINGSNGLDIEQFNYSKWVKAIDKSNKDPVNFDLGF